MGSDAGADDECPTRNAYFLPIRSPMRPNASAPNGKPVENRAQF